MTVITFDTLKFTKKLEKSGLPPERAEAIAEAFKEASTKQPPAKAGGFELRTGSPDTRRLNDASYGGSILNSSLGLGSK